MWALPLALWPRRGPCPTRRVTTIPSPSTPTDPERLLCPPGRAGPLRLHGQADLPEDGGAAGRQQEECGCPCLPPSQLPRGPRSFSAPVSPWPCLQVVAFKSDGSVLLNELKVNLPHVTGESCSGCPDLGGDGGGRRRWGMGRPPPPHRPSHPPSGPPTAPHAPPHRTSCTPSRPPSCPSLAASFSIFQPSSYHLVVITTFGLKLQIQLVPVMQLFLTLDQAAQGRVQGERPRPAPPRGRRCASAAPAFPTLSWPLRPLRELQWPRRGRLQDGRGAGGGHGRRLRQHLEGPVELR